MDNACLKIYSIYYRPWEKLFNSHFNYPIRQKKYLFYLKNPLTVTNHTLTQLL